jgi:hypothetical protein
MGDHDLHSHQCENFKTHEKVFEGAISMVCDVWEKQFYYSSLLMYQKAVYKTLKSEVLMVQPFNDTRKGCQKFPSKFTCPGCKCINILKFRGYELYVGHHTSIFIEFCGNGIFIAK